VVDGKKQHFDHQALYEVTRVVTRNLNRIIDINFYPVAEARYSNLRNRPLGIGVQGLADAFILMRFPYESKEARRLNRDIFETIYFAALTESVALAQVEGPHPTYKGSPMSRGILQFDMWNVVPDSKRWDWDALRVEIKKHGVRNSLLVAPMPTATTSQILGNNECFEPYTSNLYVRRTLAGEFVCVSKHLLRDLVRLDLWSPALRNKLIAHHGSVQNMHEVPQDIKNLYKTVYEMSGRTILDMAADRGPYIDHSQSQNSHMKEPSYEKMTSMHFHAWRLGLKTGMYYFRTQAAVEAIGFAVDQKMLKASETVPTSVSVPTSSSTLVREGKEPVATMFRLPEMERSSSDESLVSPSTGTEGRVAGAGEEDSDREEERGELDRDKASEEELAKLEEAVKVCLPRSDGGACNSCGS
jgi:ribonucleotide reductase alpha subunit